MSHSGAWSVPFLLRYSSCADSSALRRCAIPIPPCLAGFPLSSRACTHAHTHMHTRKCSVRTAQHIGKRAVIPESGLSVHPASLIPSWVMDYVKSKPPLLCFSIFSCINGDTGNDLSKLMRIKRENILKSCECRTWHIVSPHDILLSRSVTSYHHETDPSPIAFVVC